MSTVLTIAALGCDTWRNRKLNKTFLGGSILLIVSFPGRLMIAGTHVWMRIAEWMAN